jgi:hypothetical protein
VFLWKKLYRDIDGLRLESWRSLAKKKGVTPSVFTRISQGNPISVENLIKILGREHLGPLEQWVKR